MNLYLIVLLATVIPAVAVQLPLLILNWQHWRLYLQSSVWAAAISSLIYWSILWMWGVPWHMPWQDVLKPKE